MDRLLRGIGYVLGGAAIGLLLVAVCNAAHAKGNRMKVERYDAYEVETDPEDVDVAADEDQEKEKCQCGCHQAGPKLVAPGDGYILTPGSGITIQGDSFTVDGESTEDELEKRVDKRMRERLLEAFEAETEDSSDENHAPGFDRH